MKTIGLLRKSSFPGSQEYWESRYANSGTSGYGSYGKLSEFKAEIINNFIKEQNVLSVVEFGCGDGAQLSMGTYPSYIGLDVSKTSIKSCTERFKYDGTKSFFLYDPNYFIDKTSTFKADLVLSLDVIYHLIEDEIFEIHIRHLFSAAKRFVIIYSSNQNQNYPLPHVKHRLFSKWVETHFPEWRLLIRIPNRYPFQNNNSGSLADFFIYEKV
ncbi:MAG: class I SAM-dependent methyltransferase [Desulfuromonadales bacterium]|nr:class I SAM-dependent methyltransferase [Desulfuromonadales bacterium]